MEKTTRGADTRRLTLVGHLGELRKRLLICLAAVLVFSMGGLFLAPRVIGWLKRPAGVLLPRLAFFHPLEAMLAHLKVGIAVGFFVSMPILLYELWAFVRPGLTQRERRLGVAFVVWGSLLFAVGSLFAYWGLLPLSFRFLLTFSEETLEPVISIRQYLSFTLAVLLGCGLLFELPVAIFFLTRLGIVTPQLLHQHWRAALLAVVVLAALVTPTQDIVTLLLMTIPLLFLYGVSLLVSTLARGRP